MIIWLFRKALVMSGDDGGLLARLDVELKERGYFALGGQLPDRLNPEAFGSRV